MAKQNDNSRARVELARDIYTRSVVDHANMAMTTEHLVARAFDKADAFYSYLEKRRLAEQEAEQAKADPGSGPEPSTRSEE